MISKELSIRLKKAADKYEKPEFIKNDPIQFPHRFSSKCDIEISGLLTAIMSFGNRKQIIAKAEILHGMMCGEPREYILTRAYESHFPAGKTESFYRMLSYGAFRNIFDILYNVYANFPDLESYMRTLEGTPMERMCRFLKVSSKSPQKKINIFLRWMVRKDSPVDFGIWQRFSPAELIIPLDTHVVQMAHKTGITDSETYSLAAARKITETLSDVFPGDPVRGDFALFGAGVEDDSSYTNNKQKP